MKVASRLWMKLFFDQTLIFFLNIKLWQPEKQLPAYILYLRSMLRNQNTYDQFQFVSQPHIILAKHFENTHQYIIKVTSKFQRTRMMNRKLYKETSWNH
jgi:hypothetical protein